MALNAKLKKAVSLGLITPAQAELLANQTEQETKKTVHNNVPSFFVRVTQILGGVLAISGIGVFTYWANLNFAPVAYTLLLLGYLCLSLLAFDWLRRTHNPLPAAISGLIFTAITCTFLLSLFTLLGWFDPTTTTPQWGVAHSVTLAMLIAAAAIARRLAHWLTNFSLALNLAGFILVIIAHLNHAHQYSETSSAIYLLLAGFITTVCAYLWRFKVSHSLPNHTLMLHIVAAIYFYAGLTTLEPGLNIVPQSLPYLTLYLVLIILGVLMQRRAYSIGGAISIIGFTADKLWLWLGNPLLFSFITIGLGLFMVYGVSRTSLYLPSQWAKKLPLPAWLTHN